MYRKYQNTISVVCLALILIIAMCVAVSRAHNYEDVEQIIEAETETETNIESEDKSETETEIIDVTSVEESRTKEHIVVNNTENNTTTTKNEIETTKAAATTIQEQEVVVSETTTSETTAVEDAIDCNTAETNETEDVYEDDGKVYLGEFRLTAYCNCSTCCGVWAGGATASGKMPREGRTIAVDTSVIPLGATVEINGHTYIAEDTGSAIKGNRIDVYFDSHQTASDFGVRYADVYRVY